MPAVLLPSFVPALGCSWCVTQVFAAQSAFVPSWLSSLDGSASTHLLRAHVWAVISASCPKALQMVTPHIARGMVSAWLAPEREFQH